jgi:hypothetical protein
LPPTSATSPTDRPTLERTGPAEPTPTLARRLAAVAVRARLQRAIVALPPLATGLGAGLAAVFLALDLGAVGEAEALSAAAVAGLATLGLVALAALRPLEPLALAVALDRALSLRGRLGNALALAHDPSPMAALARRDAERHAARIDPRAVLPYRWPRSIAGAVALLVAAGALFASGPLRGRPRAAEGAGAPRLEVAQTPAAVDPDALAALRERMAETRREGELAPEVEAANAAINALIEEIARGELGVEEALARIAELETSLDRAAPSRSGEVQRELADAARQMRESAGTEALARALREGELARAAEELSALAQRTRTEPPPRELLENLRALAADREREARERALEEAAQEEERLLERRREREARGEEPPEEQERLLEQRQRELERLRREHETRQEVERQLEELRRELGDAADRMEEEHRRPSQSAGEAMERAAEELRQQAREQQSAEQMRELARELHRLREALREAQRPGQEGQGQQGQGEGQGQDGPEGGRDARMRRFVLRAGGGDGTEGIRLGAGRPGGSPGEGDEDPGGGGAQGGERAGRGAEGAGGEQPGGEGSQGAGQAGEMLRLGEGGDAVLEIPGLGRPGGGGPPEAGGEGEGRQGPGRGTGHDGAPLEDPTARLAGGRAVRVQGQPGEGPSRSQVIRGASSDGFASRDYERVYEDYASHAEQAVERDRVPPGYRGYVQRYFELIRPRETAPP